jgi:plasmid stability protein
MDQQTPNYRAEFFKSPHHAALGLLTLGVGIVSGAVLPLIVGGTLYAIGWVHIPDMAFFRKWVDGKHDAVTRAAEQERVAEFQKRRDVLLAGLASERRRRYEMLAQVCRDIESASAENPMASQADNDPRLRKLDELMWTYLRLLSIEESLERYLETERRDNLPSLLNDANAEVARLSAEVDAIKAKGPNPALETKQRYLGSRMERLEVLKKRQERMCESQDNLAFVVSEEERLDQQVKLIRADAVAMKNAESLTARIDATVEHLDQTNKWIAEMDEFKDLVGDMPATEMRVGYNTNLPPPVIDQSRRTIRLPQGNRRN